MFKFEFIQRYCSARWIWHISSTTFKCILVPISHNRQDKMGSHSLRLFLLSVTNLLYTTGMVVSTVWAGNRPCLEFHLLFSPIKRRFSIGHFSTGFLLPKNTFRTSPLFFHSVSTQFENLAVIFFLRENYILGG